ncbi:hypothetical protein [Leptolyngbya sp. 7M]|uniref:hypothetical protein n=1 Tax=Leptolyngbya sp. 7M TaxID=2812896 RepID=UPI001B8AA49B|nr:hypothetical protein [Leptolyngbya sp. 7M]QYO61931.1 hypothetical protein JVX88_17515 [Leptolyngbya sp. 7M]
MQEFSDSEQTSHKFFFDFVGALDTRDSDPRRFGWFVGYLEQNNNTYFFATNITMPSADDAAKRLDITRRCFKALGLL